jgi:hypothetical protein
MANIESGEATSLKKRSGSQSGTVAKFKLLRQLNA